jgi:hypothetical protein
MVAKHDRLREANEVILAISQHGRRFFRHEKSGRVSRFELDLAGRLWLRDRYSNRRIYVAYRGPWRYFSEGGTLRGIVEALANYVRTGQPIRRGLFGPWPQWICDGDLWGYGAQAMEALRTQIESSPAIARQATLASGAAHG